jgi:hypothetical protein
MIQHFPVFINVRCIFTGPLKMAVDIGGMRKPYRDRKDTFDISDLVGILWCYQS